MAELQLGRQRLELRPNGAKTERIFYGPTMVNGPIFKGGLKFPSPPTETSEESFLVGLNLPSSPRRHVETRDDYCNSSLWNEKKGHGTARSPSLHLMSEWEEGGKRSDRED